MADLYRYGSMTPVPFKVLLNGAGVAGLTFQAADIQLSIDGGAFSNIGAEVSEIGNGWYQWTPSASTQTQGKVLIINIKDTSGSSLFDENAIKLFTGGDTNAFYDGA